MNCYAILRVKILNKYNSTHDTPLHEIILHVLHKCGYNAVLTFLVIVTYNMSLTFISSKSSALDDYVRTLTLSLPVLTLTYLHVLIRTCTYLYLHLHVRTTVLRNDHWVTSNFRGHFYQFWEFRTI